MIRVGPVGIILAFLFVVIGPHGGFLASNVPSQSQSQNVASSVLPDAASVPDQPRRSFVDAVETKQGWKVRIASERQLLGYLLVGAVVFAFYWPLRQKALARKRDQADLVEGQNSGDD